MSIIKEFREFAIKGNVVDLAVGVIIGTAFGKIVSSLVSDVVMPILGLIVSGVDFTDLAITLKDGVGEKPPVLLKYGVFVQSVFDFLIVAIAVFMMVKVINRLKRTEAAAPPPPSEPTREEILLSEIRDILRDQKR